MPLNLVSPWKITVRELLKLSEASEETLGNSCISDWFSPSFFETNFWSAAYLLFFTLA
jgi:myosin-crossreactive antigen